MTPNPEGRRALSLLRHGSRSTATCFYRCGNACDHPVPNTSDNAYFGDIAARVLSRRRVLQAGGAGAFVLGTGQLLAPNHATAASAAPAPNGTEAVEVTNLRFRAVPPNTFDTVTVPDNYEWAVVAKWGDPVEIGADPFDPYNQTPDKQAKQFGYNCDYVAVMPLDGNRAVLVVNHEYTNEQIMFPDYGGVAHTNEVRFLPFGGATPTPDQKRIAMMAHGLSVVVIERGEGYGEWRLPPNPDPVNRRITVSTPMIFTGPASGHELLRTADDPLGTGVIGTLNNCAGGTTPWGTVLSGEENFNGYFDASGPVDPAYTAAFSRYGLLTTAGTTRGWSEVDERFDLARHPNEANRHGWIVELDPRDPAAPPVKHTMLGRFKHEGATIRLAEDGRAVAYMGDDQAFDYLYKFVSRDPMSTGTDAAAREFNRRLLDYGTLYVARFEGDSPEEEIDGSGLLPSDGEFDGTGKWIRLADDRSSYVPGMSVAEVLINTRLAADLVGPTKMDRPEDVEPNPVTGRVYMACTNNVLRTVEQVDEPNPRPTNRHGHVVEIKERRNDAAARRFKWQLVVVCGDPADPTTYFAGFDKSRVSPISCPDNVAFDPPGNLWISTDGNALGSHDGLFAMPVKGRQRGFLKQFMSMPVAAETCGPLITDDSLSVFVAVQHPGETGTFEKPTSEFPDGPGNPPKPSVVCAWHRSGLPIGSR